MTKQEKFTDAIKHNKIEVIESFLKDPDINPVDFFHLTCVSSVEKLVIFNIFLNDKRIDPSAYNNYATYHAAYYGCTEIIKKLLKDDRVDPSDRSNNALSIAYKCGYEEIVSLLFQDKRVKISLKKEKIDFYNYLTNKQVKLNIGVF